MIIIEHYIRSQRMENIAMAEKQKMDAMWDDSPIDVSTEVNFIWSIANKLRGTYQSDKYKDVIIPMVIIRRFECALAPTKQKVQGESGISGKGDVSCIRISVLQHQ